MCELGQLFSLILPRIIATQQTILKTDRRNLGAFSFWELASMKEPVHVNLS